MPAIKRESRLNWVKFTKVPFLQKYGVLGGTSEAQNIQQQRLLN
jgi:hypothetical protein